MHDPHTNRIPLGYLITFRAHGTWLHGDVRGSVDRFHNRYGTPDILPNPNWFRYNERIMKTAPIKLDARRRAVIEEAIKETCKNTKVEVMR